MSKQLAIFTKKIEILPRALSDHNPLIWTMKDRNRKPRWRLNEDILSKKKNVEHLMKETDCFFKTNWNTEVKSHIVWDAYKAVIRGNMIAINARERKKREERMKDLQCKLKEKEKELLRKPGEKRLQMEIRLIKEIYGMLNKELEWKLKYLKQREFEGGNKPGKFLAWQIKKKREQKIISKIRAKME